MRRSPVVQLTLLPMLATAAVASIAAADPPSIYDGPPPMEAAGPPGQTGPALTPPGMTPAIIALSCNEDPNWRLRPDCEEDAGYYYQGHVIRGGFGGYFHGGGGG
jgi:hypothetical protein